MRDSKVRDYWRKINEGQDKYPTRIKSFSLNGVDGFDDDFSISFPSSISAVCGKNGAGKSTLMKYIFESISGRDCGSNKKRVNDAQFNADVFHDFKVVDFAHSEQRDNVYYIEPSRECSSILDYIKSTENFDELLQGVEISKSLNDDGVRGLISKIVGKPYESILFYEINEAMSHPLEYPFPYFVVSSCGVEYSNLDMGMGEFSCLYIVWFILFSEPKSIIFIEEPENFISAYSQINLINYIASVSWEKKLWFILSTHSEHILSSIGQDSISILSPTGKNRSSCASKPKNINRYLTALGVAKRELGCFLVEDEFAGLFLQNIIKLIDSDLLSSYKIVQVECESNIEKIIGGFVAKSEVAYEMVAVFDADQWAKIATLSGKKIYVTALPSGSGSAPENELWPILQSAYTTISDELHIDKVDFLEAVQRFETDDHHQKFQNVCKELGVSINQLVSSAVYEWSLLEKNKKLMSDFYLTFCNRKKSFDTDISGSDIDIVGVYPAVRINISEDIRKDKKQKASLIFNGKKLLAI